MNLKTLLKNEILDNIINEIKKPKYKDKINTYLLEPSICYILNKIYPYLIITAIFFILILLITIVMLFLIIRSNNIILKKLIDIYYIEYG